MATGLDELLGEIERIKPILVVFRSVCKTA